MIKSNFQIIVHIALINLFLFSQSLLGQNKYKLATDKEALIFAGSTSLIVGSLLLERNVTITPQELHSLDYNKINFFDRTAVKYYSQKTSLVSDVLLITTICLPSSFLFINEAKNDLKEIGLMYLEALLLNFGMTNFTKNIVQRYRPYAYNNSVDLDDKLNTDTKKSFFSGHTSTAFTSAAFFSTVFSELSSDKKAEFFVWTGTLSLASTVSMLRYFSGKHFPTDILVGAIVGSIIGYSIPNLHKMESNFSSNVNHNSISITLNFDSRIFK